MIKKEKLNELSKNLSANRDDFISAFRHNLFMYIDEKDITIKDISENANVPFSTLNSFLYGDSKDIKLSTAVKLARALNVSIDELIGADTINEVSRESISICRNLPDNALYLIRWYIRYIDSLNKKNEPHKRYISVMKLDCNQNGNLKITTDYKHIDITEIDKECSCNVFFGITMPCDHYMPVYSPYDILLIANDREPTLHENSLIRVNGCLFIAKKKNNEYFSIRDGKFRFKEQEIDEHIGYVACTIRNDDIME